jgi:hypothetical protein
VNAPDMLFLCNEAAVGRTGSPKGVAKLRTFGSGKNVRLELDDVGRQLNQNIPAALIDLVEIAALVYVADQMEHRGANDVESMGTGWRRRLRFEIPVRVPTLWKSAVVSDALIALLSFLSEDEYEFTFTQYKAPPTLDSYLNFAGSTTDKAPDSVILFSGGLDSLGGVVKEVVQDGRSALLLTHESTTKLRTRHRTLRGMIDSAAKGPPPQHITVRVNKKDQIEREYTQRARSFLYASLAVAVSRMAGLDAIRFYENGIVSLNLPLSPQVVGSRATRTTHPRVLACMRRLFSLVTDTTFGVDNGFIWKTKSDVVRDILASGNGSMIPLSTSCTHTWVFSNAKPHCGTCSQCIDRRFAVLAGGAGAFERADTYSHDLLVDARDAGESRVMLASYVEIAQQVSEMSETDFFNRFGEAARVLMHVGLPADEAARKVHQLYQQHGKQVMSVVDAAMETHKAAIRKRTLPESCLLRLVHDPNPVVVASGVVGVAPQPEPPPPAYRLVQMGQGWTLRFDGVEKHFELSIGMVYLREMIAFPAKRFTVAELYVLARPHMKDIPSARSEAAFDQTAARAYWKRLSELDEAIAAAEKAGDATAASVAKNEKERLLAELKAANFKGRPKTESKDHKRLRDRVRNAVDRAIETITKYHTAAGTHFDAAVTRGSVMGYNPTETPPWEF